MTLNAYLNSFRSVKRSNRAMSWNASSLACIPTKQHGVRGGKYLLNTPGDAISETLNFKMSLDASALKNVRLWCEFQSHLLFIISLLLKNFLTALLLLVKLKTSSTKFNDGILLYPHLWKAVVSRTDRTKWMQLDGTYARPLCPTLNDLARTTWRRRRNIRHLW